MPLRTVHIVSSLDRINFGIWNAAIFAFEELTSKYNCESYLWVTASPPSDPLYTNQLKISWFPGTGVNVKSINESLERHNFRPADTLIITHGSWLRPTRFGHYLAGKKFRWLYVPHGMLEPWSTGQGFLKKLIYLYFFEGRYITKASSIRAVSGAEKKNLEEKLKRKIELVENGVQIPVAQEKGKDMITYLFIGRLHYKKGILPLVRAWNAIMKDERSARLIIAGPDEGELTKIQPYLQGNIEYVGAVYSDEKRSLLKDSHYFVLPSYSEGFPVSVLEAMSYGLTPLISSGCNFGEVFDLKLGYRVEPNEDEIGSTLSLLKKQPFDNELSDRARKFIDSKYSEKVIGRQLFDLYSSL